MMYPPAFEIASADAGVQAVLGTSPVRFWPFGQAPQNETRPYAVHQLVYGSPENTLSCPPDIDNYGLQVDAYAKTASAARSVAEALRNAFQLSANIVGYDGEDWESSTGLYRVGFTVEFWTNR